MIEYKYKSDFGLQEVKNQGRMELPPFTVAFLSGRRHALFPGVYWQHEASKLLRNAYTPFLLRLNAHLEDLV